MNENNIEINNHIIPPETIISVATYLNDKLKEYNSIYQNEAIKNEALTIQYQEWSFKNENSTIKYEIAFKNKTEIKFDNYNNFITVFNNRIDEIKDIHIYFYLRYSKKREGEEGKYYNSNIYISIYENKLSLEASKKEGDELFDDIYNTSVKMFNDTPKRYTKLIRNRRRITLQTGITMGFVPSTIIAIILILIPTTQEYIFKSYILFFIIYTLITLFLGVVIGNSVLGSLYNIIAPKKKYAGYDDKKHKSIYEDDIEQFPT